MEDESSEHCESIILGSRGWGNEIGKVEGGLRQALDHQKAVQLAIM